ncbi:MAG: peptidoglycan DD-metalloendopeptidase family protein [Gallionellaceae bacterium]
MSLPFRFALLLLASTLCLHSAHANQQHELEILRQRISALQHEMEKTSDSKAETADALRESERAISNSNRILHKLAKQQRELNLSLGHFQQQSKKISGEMQQQQVLLAKLLHQQYLGGQQEYFKLLLNNHDPNQTARELQYYEYIAQSRAAWLKNMRENLAKLGHISTQARQKNIELSTLQAEQAQQKQSLLREKNEHQQVLKKIAQQLKQQRLEIGRLQRDENRLATLLENLSRIVAEPKTKPATKDADEIVKRPLNTPFVSLRGKLPLPVHGQITNKFGSRRPDSPVLWKGLFIRAASSQPVNAVAPGRVIFADWLRGFGNLLIIDHGRGYMSLYGNNETLYKQLGDELQAGDTIAAVGNSGGNENYGLYFELRHEGIPLDPDKWVKRRSSRAR